MDDKTKVIKEFRERGDKAVDALTKELAKLRTGRASVAILDGITVDYYGTETLLNQMANLSVPEPRLITVQPWDISQIGAIEKALMASDLGLTPANDGKLIRLPIPQLTEERRKEIAKLAKKYGEECKVSVRNARRDANDEFKKLEKDKVITEDEHKKSHDDVQKVTDQEVKRVDELVAKKEKEIMEV
jgi:ribosome recycling factor